MDISLTQRQLEMQMLAHDFGEQQIKPVAMAIDQIPDPQQAFPVSLMTKALDIGFQSMCIPKEYGGLGLDCLTHALMFEEFGAADIGFALSLQAHNLALALLLNSGTEAQRAQFLKPIVDGGLAAIASVEPNTPSAATLLDPKNFTWDTQAVRDGDDWIINGQKVFGSNAGTSLNKWILITARTDMTQVGMPANSLFLIWPDTPGVKVGNNYDKLGHRMAYTPTIDFENVRVPHSQLLGGKSISLSGERQPRLTTADNYVNVAAQSVGLARAIYGEALAFAQTRVTNGKPMAEHQAVALKLANMYIEIEAARALLWRVACMSDSQPQMDRKLPIATKVFCSDMVANISRDGLQIFGGRGYRKDTLIEKLYRDAKGPEIYEGANDSLRITIAQLINWGL